MASLQDVQTVLEQFAAEAALAISEAQAASDKANALLAIAQSDLSAAQNQSAQYIAVNQSLNQTVASQTATIATLRAQLNNLKPPTLFGAAVLTHSGETWPLALTRVEKTLGPLEVVRVYDNSQGITRALWAAQQAGMDKRPVVLSWKSDPTRVVSGADDALYKSSFAQFNDNTYWCYAHEMDAKIQQKQYTAEQFLAAWKHIHDLWKAGNYKGKAIQIFTGYQIEPRLASLYVGDAYCDLLGIDPYATLSTQYAIDVVAPILNSIAKVTSKPVAITEIGGMYNPQNPIFVKSLAELKYKVPFICWFNSTGAGLNGTTVDFQIDTVPACAVEYNKLHN